MRVTLTDIASVLIRWESRYRWVDLFASDVVELVENAPVFLKVDENRYQVQVGESLLELIVYPSENIARFEIARPRVGAATGALVGAVIASSNASRPRELQDTVLGLLIGGLIGAAVDRAADETRIMPLAFDPATHDWRVYHGPYLNWAKSALRPAV